MADELTDNSERITSATTESFVASLILNSVIAGVEILAFVVIRKFFKAVYEPRSYMPPDDNKVEKLTPSWLGVVWQILRSDPTIILQRNGVDAYVFIRFHRMMMYILVPIWLLSWVILFPVDSVGVDVPGKDGLDQFTFGNVDRSHQSRLWAHLVLAWVFTAWIGYNIRKEMTRWVLIRQKYLINPYHSSLAQANTILITGISHSYLSEDRLEQLFHHLPGGVKRIWLNRDLKDMVPTHKARVKATKLLESAQVTLIKKAAKIKLKRENAREKATKKGKKLPEDGSDQINKDILQGQPSPSVIALEDLGDTTHHNGMILADQLVPRKNRPQHRVGGHWWLPFSGKKVDTIDWARQEVIRTGMILADDRARLHSDIAKPGTEGEMYPPLNSAFIYFHQQIAAHMAAQIVLHDQPYRMTGHFLEVAPEDVVWSNLNINPYWGQIRRLISYTITAGLLFFWSFPTAFVGALSNLSGLCVQWSWLSWLCQGGPVVKGIIQGALPPILLALLNLLLPIILRLLARFEGIPRKTGIELSLMTRYTISLVFNSFLVLTLASGLITAIPQIVSNPVSIPGTLAERLPLASTFFLTFTMQKAAASAGSLLQIVQIVIYFVKLIIQGGTPRSVYKQKYTMRRPEWGETFPNSTIIAIISISYMIISPIINGFAVAAFALAYVIYKYLYTWVIDQPPSSDTGGLFFPKAITHLFVGLYIQQIALCALFFLARNANNNVSAIPQAVLTIILIVTTVIFQIGIVNSYSPLKTTLPLSLAYLSYGMPKEGGHEGSVTEGSEGGFDPRPLAQERADSESKIRTMSQISRQRSRASLPQFENDPEKANQPMAGGAAETQNGTAPPPPLRQRKSANQVKQEYEMSTMSNPANGHELDLGDGNATHIARTSAGPPLQPSHTHTNAQTMEAAHDHRIPQLVRQVDEWLGEDDPIAAHRQELEALEEPQDHEGVGDDGGRGRTEIARDAFTHPAAKEPQRVVWLPQDELGLAAAESTDNRAIGILSTTRDAFLSQKGKVSITGPPPDSFEATDDK